MKALLIIDVQNDFLPKGALGVPEGDRIIPIINKLMSYFSMVVATQDWHPRDHISFAANHPGKKPGDIIIINGLEQILWPTHCVQGTEGAEIAKELQTSFIDEVFHKGTDPSIDSYSAFFDNARQKPTGLSAFLQSKKVTEIYVTGLATDYCVLYSSIDAIEEGFQVVVVHDACRGINLKKGDVERALQTMRDAGVKILSSHQVTSSI